MAKKFDPFDDYLKKRKQAEEREEEERRRQEKQASTKENRASYTKTGSTSASSSGAIAKAGTSRSGVYREGSTAASSAAKRAQKTVPSAEEARARNAYNEFLTSARTGSGRLSDSLDYMPGFRGKPSTGRAQRATDIATRAQNLAGALYDYGVASKNVGVANDAYRLYRQAMDRSERAWREEEGKKLQAETAKPSNRWDRAVGVVRDVVDRATGTDHLRQAGREYDMADFYAKMAAAAGETGNEGMYGYARGQYEQRAAAGADASRRGAAQYDQFRRQQSPAYYYGTSLTTEQIEGQLRMIDRDLEQNSQDRQDTMAALDQFGTFPDDNDPKVKAARKAATDADHRYQELVQQRAIFTSALQTRQTLDRRSTISDISGSVINDPNFDRLVLAGRQMYETQNQNASRQRDEYYAENDPDILSDPDEGGLGFEARMKEYDRKAEEFGYVTDLDSPYLSDEQKAVYYALYATDRQKAEEYAKACAIEGEEQHWAQLADEAGRNTGTRLRALVEGTFANTMSGLRPFSEEGQYMNKYGSTLIGGGAKGLTEQGLFNSGLLAGEFDAPLFGKISLGSAYQLGSSMLQSGANALVASSTGGLSGVTGALGTILLGSSAAASDYRERIEAGWDESAARQHAIAAGIAEAGFEYLSLDKLINQNAARGWLRNLLVQGGVEASEEISTTLANTLSDAYIAERNGYDNSFEERAQELMAQGWSYEGARHQARMDWITEILNDGLGGFLSGGIMSGAPGAVQSTMNTVRNASEISKYGELAMVPQEQRDAAWSSAAQERSGIRTAQRYDSMQEYLGGTADRILQTKGGISAVRAFAEDNGIKVQDKDFRDIASGKSSDMRGYGKTVQTVVEQVSDRMTEAGTLQGAEKVYTALIEKYGEGIRPVADMAMERAGATFTGDNTSSVTGTVQSAQNIGSETVLDEQARKAAQRGADFAVYDQMIRAQEAEQRKAGKNYLRRASGQMSMEVEVQSEDGSTSKAGVVALTQDRKGVVLSDGSTVSLDKIQTDAESKDVLDVMAASKMTEQASAEMLDALASVRKDGSIDTRDWASDYIEAYDRGTVGVKSIDEAVTMAKNLPARIASQAYQAGQRDAGEIPTAQRMKMDELRKKVQPGATGRRGVFYADGVSEQTLNRLKNDKATGAEFRAQVEAMKLIAKATGVDIYLREMSQADAEGRLSGAQGSYKKGVIVIDVNAGLDNINRDLNRGLLAVTGHELTHWMKEAAPEAFTEYRDAVRDALVRKIGADEVDKLIDGQMAADTRLSREEALEEVVADAGMRFISDEAFWGAVTESLGEDKHSIKQKIQKFFRDFFAKLREILGKTSHVGEAARIVDELEEAVQKSLGKLYAEGIRQASETWQQVGDVAMGSQSGQIPAGAMSSNLDSPGHVVGNLEVDANGNVNRNSIRTIPKTEEGWENLIKDLVRAGFDEDQAKSWINDMRSVAASIFDAMQNDGWNPLDYESDPRSDWFRTNSGYPQGTIDFSNNCPRREEFTAQFDAAMKMLPNFEFDAQDYETLRGIIKDAGIPVPCGGCYVDERRQHLSEVGQMFIDQYRAALRGETKKALKPKFFNKVKAQDKSYNLTLDDLVSSDGLLKLFNEHRSLYDSFMAFNNNRGMQSIRMVFGLSEYKGQIKNWKKNVITRKNKFGGIRLFSYSDADPRIVLDFMQIVTDAAEKGLMMQGYTKKPWFAVFAKDTGLRILRSHIPLGVGFKTVNGQKVLSFDNFEGIDTRDQYYRMIDRDRDLNIGNNVIGINDTQIRLAMVSDMIDQIIPFHTGLKGETLEQKGLGHWRNYKEFQEDKVWSNGGWQSTAKAKNHINLYEDVLNTIDWSQTETRPDGTAMTDAERFVNRYLEVCRERGFKPRFAQFLLDENGDYVEYDDDHYFELDEKTGKMRYADGAHYTYNPGYEKFLVDFRLFDKAGKIIPQVAVQPNFDTEFIRDYFGAYVEEHKTKHALNKDVQNTFLAAMESKYGKAALEQGKKNTAQDDGARRSYRGVNAKTADLTLLEQAEEMLANGTDSETVRQQTGWFKGMDGKWRFEINDSSVRVDKYGDLNGRIAAYNAFQNAEEALAYEAGTSLEIKLQDKATFEESVLIDKYKDAVRGKHPRTANRIYRQLSSSLGTTFTQWADAWRTVEEFHQKYGYGAFKKVVSDYIDAAELFEAYPRLAEIPIQWEDFGDGSRGMYDGRSISLDRSLRSDPDQLKSTLLHELQHAVQEIEGFARGSSPEAWRIKHDAKMKRLTKQVQSLSESLDAMYADIGYEDYYNDLERRTYVDEEITPAEMDRLLDEYVKKHSPNYGYPLLQQYKKALDAYHEAQKDGTPFDMYQRTAGEIESRDVQNRMGFTDEERRNIRPDIDREDVVFTENEDIRYSTREYNPTVVLTEQTIDKYLADYAAKSSPNYAQAYIVQMRPDDFLRLTTSKAGMDRIYRETGDLDVEKLKDASIHQPFQLHINSKTGQVEGHEGRHRAMALSNNGIRRIPVLMFDSSNKYSKTAMAELTLKGQDFGDSRSYDRVTVKDVQPLSYANRDNIVQKFTTQPSLERISEQYGDTETIRYSTRGDQSLRDRVSDLEEQLELAEANGLSQAEIRRLNNELIKAKGQLDAYTANQRRQAKRTSYNEILQNLEHYDRSDLESMAEQVSNGAWDDYEDLSDDELIDALRETISERMEDFGPGDADNPKYGMFVKQPQTSGISIVRRSTRDTSMPSDVELIEGLDEAKADTPEGKALVKDAKRSASKLEDLRKKLAAAVKDEAELRGIMDEVKRQFSTTDRKLKTKGIATVSQGIMKDLGAGDTKNRGVAKRISAILTEVYQKALDQIDNGTDIPTVADYIYSAAAVKISDILSQDATHSEKFGSKWATVSLGRYYGEEGRQSLVDTVFADIMEDFFTHRYRDAIQPTEADRIVERVEGRMQKKVDAAKAQNAELAKQNQQMTEEIEELRQRRTDAEGHIKDLAEQLADARNELKAGKKMSEDEQKKAERKVERLTAQLAAARKTAQTMKGLLARRMLTSEHEAQMRKVERERNAEQAAARKREAALQADVEGYSRWGERAGEAIAAAQADSAGWERVADLSAKEIDRLMRDKRSLIKKLEDQIAREEKILQGVLKPPAIQKMLSEAKRTAASEARKAKDAVIARAKDRRAISALMGRIRNLTAEIKRTATNPTDRSYMPAHLAGAMVDLLDLLEQAEVDTPKAGTKAAVKYYNTADAIRAMADEYKKLAKDPDYAFSSEFDEDVYDGIVQLAKQFERTATDGHRFQITAKDMTLAELQQVYDTIRDIRNGLRNATRMIGMDEAMSVYDFGRKIIQGQKMLRAIKEGKKGKKLRGWMNTVQIDALSPMRAAHMIDGYQDAEFYQLWQAIEEGLGDKNRVFMESNKRLQSFKTGKNELTYLRALRDKTDFGIKDVDGKTVMLTKMQALQLLMTWQRETANDRLVHMQEGGVIIRDADLIARGKYDDATKTQQYVHVMPEMIAGIESKLTEWDRGYIEAAREVFTSLLEQSNRVLYALKHKVHKGEAMYIPEKVADDYLSQEVVKGGEFNLGVKEAGATKDLQQRSTIPIIIDGLETMLNRHINDMANYIGLALPIRNFAKVYNMRTTGTGIDATTVNQEIAQTWGGKAGDMMMETLRQVQNGRSYEYQTVMSNLERHIQSAFVKASLVGKISVFIKQAASYAAAGSVLSQKALDRSQQYIFALVTAPNSKMARRIYERIDRLTPEHYMRRQGMSMEEIAMDKLSTGPVKDKLQRAGAWMESKGGVGKAARHLGQIVNPTNWIQRMDVATTGALVIACERQAKYDGYKRGTAEYDAHVRELYQQVIRQTQPMYDPLHRPALQKNAGALAKMAMPFRTVPFQNYGQIMDSFGNLQAAMRDGTKAEKVAAAKHVGKTVWANFESTLVFAALGALAYAIQHKPKRYTDDDEELTLESFLRTYGSDVLDVTLGNLLPYGGTELKDIAERFINGDKWYDAVSVGSVDLINNTVKSIVNLVDESKKFTAGDASWESLKEQLYSTTLQMTTFFGIPASNVKDILKGVRAGWDDWMNGRWLWLNDANIERSNTVNARRFIKAMEDGDPEKANSVMEEFRRNILNKKPGLKEDKVNQTIQNAITAYVKDLYMSDELDEATATKYLVDYGSAEDEHDAYWKIREWEAKDEHAGDDEYTFNKYEELRALVVDGADISSEVKRLTDHGVKAESVNDDVKETIKDLFYAGKLSEDEVIEYLQRYHQTKDSKGKQYRTDTEDEAWETVQEWKAKQAHKGEEDYSWSKYERLREAILSGGDVQDEIDLLVGHGSKEEDVYKDIGSTVKAMLTEGSITADQAEDLLLDYWKVKDKDTKEFRPPTENEVWAKVNAMEGAIEHADEEGYSYGQYDEIDEAIASNQDIGALVKDMTDHGVKAENITSHVKGYLIDRYAAGGVTETALKNQLARYCGITVKKDVDEILKNANSRKEFGVTYDELDSEYRAGKITKTKMKSALMKYGGLDSDEADRKIRWYDLQKSNPNLTITEADCNRWYEGTKDHTQKYGHRSAKEEGMSIEKYVSAHDILDKVEKSSDKTREENYIQAITGINGLTGAQRWALYYEEYSGANWKKIAKPNW